MCVGMCMHVSHCGKSTHASPHNAIDVHGRHSSKDSFEKSVVAWSTASDCQRCGAGYSFTKSKTHCRLCG